MREAESSWSASTIEMPLASRASAEELVADLVMPRTFQPRERNLSATEPPWINRQYPILKRGVKLIGR